jgi:hypothetical protein
MFVPLLRECYIGSVIYDQYRPGGIACEDSHQLACLVIREYIIQQSMPLQIINNGHLNNLAGLLRQWSFWLPSAQWYDKEDNLSDNFTNYRDELARLMQQLTPDQTVNQDSRALNVLVERPPTAVYLAQDSKVAYIAFFFTLNYTPHIDKLVRKGDATLLTWDVMEYYAGVCQQIITHIHGIVILQGPGMTPWHEHALHTLHPNNFINVTPLQQDSRAAWLYIQRQLINPLRVVHYFTNHVQKIIPGYIPYYGEYIISSRDQILLAARQEDCPSIVSNKWINRNDHLYNNATTLFRLHIQ